MHNEQKQNIIQQWKQLANTVWELFNAALDSLAERLHIRKSYKSGLPASTAEMDHIQPLRLNLQFFAEDPGASGGDDPNNQTDPNNTDPPDGDETPPTLAELIKLYPNIKKEVNQEKTNAVTKRLKNINFDPEEARIAIAEKREREKAQDPPPPNNSDNNADSALNKKTSKLEAKTKKLAVAAYASSKGLNAKLITALAGNQIEKLALDDDFEVDPDDVEEIVDQLRQDFPDQFPDDSDDDDLNPPPPTKRGTLSTSREKTNRRSKEPADEGLKDMEESFKRVNDRYNY